MQIRRSYRWQVREKGMSKRFGLQQGWIPLFALDQNNDNDINDEVCQMTQVYNFFCLMASLSRVDH